MMHKYCSSPHCPKFSSIFMIIVDVKQLHGVRMHLLLERLGGVELCVSFSVLENINIELHCSFIKFADQLVDIFMGSLMFVVPVW